MLLCIFHWYVAKYWTNKLAIWSHWTLKSRIKNLEHQCKASSVMAKNSFITLVQIVTPDLQMLTTMTTTSIKSCPIPGTSKGREISASQDRWHPLRPHPRPLRATRGNGGGEWSGWQCDQIWQKMAIFKGLFSIWQLFEPTLAIMTSTK